MSDRLISGTAAEGSIRFFVTDCVGTVKKTLKIHNTSVSCGYVLGKFVVAGVLMGGILKTDRELLTISTDSDGGCGKIIVTVNSKNQIKVFVENPDFEPDDEKLSAGGVDRNILGKGIIRIIRDLGLKTPYLSQVEMIHGSIANDLTYYFAASEQIPTSLSLGVLFDETGNIMKSGGFLIQLMPGCSEDIAVALEKNIVSLPNFTDLLDMGLSLEKISEDFLFKNMDLKFDAEVFPVHKCSCSKKKMRAAAELLGEKEIDEILEETGFVEVKCRFCNKKYRFVKEDFKK